jgi:chaperonin GroES
MFGKYSGTEVNIDGEDLLILREDEVLAVLETGPGTLSAE